MRVRILILPPVAQQWVSAVLFILELSEWVGLPVTVVVGERVLAFFVGWNAFYQVVGALTSHFGQHGGQRRLVSTQIVRNEVTVNVDWLYWCYQCYHLLIPWHVEMKLELSNDHQVKMMLETGLSFALWNRNWPCIDNGIDIHLRKETAMIFPISNRQFGQYNCNATYFEITR